MNDQLLYFNMTAHVTAAQMPWSVVEARLKSRVNPVRRTLKQYATEHDVLKPLALLFPHHLEFYRLDPYKPSLLVHRGAVEAVIKILRLANLQPPVMLSTHAPRDDHALIYHLKLMVDMIDAVCDTAQATLTALTKEMAMIHTGNTKRDAVLASIVTNGMFEAEAQLDGLQIVQKAIQFEYSVISA